MKFRIVRSFSTSVHPTDNKCYRVETAELMTAKEAMKLLEELGSPYGGDNLAKVERPKKNGTN